MLYMVVKSQDTPERDFLYTHIGALQTFYYRRSDGAEYFIGLPTNVHLTESGNVVTITDNGVLYEADGNTIKQTPCKVTLTVDRGAGTYSWEVSGRPAVTGAALVQSA